MPPGSWDLGVQAGISGQSPLDHAGPREVLESDSGTSLIGLVDTGSPARNRNHDEVHIRCKRVRKRQNPEVLPESSVP